MSFHTCKLKVMTAVSLIVFIFLIKIYSLNAEICGNIVPSGTQVKDSIERQIMYNGRVWKNQFLNTGGHQFFLSSDFLSGSVRINNDTFDSVKIRYDIFDDELLIRRDDYTIIRLNKELVNSFNLYSDDKVLLFLNFDNYSDDTFSGYWHVLHDSSIKIYVSYTKDILPSTMTNGIPRFNQVNTIFIYKDRRYTKVNNRKDLLELFSKDEEHKAIKKFLKNNYIRVSRQDPASFKRVVEYYETWIKESLNNED